MNRQLQIFTLFFLIFFISSPCLSFNQTQTSFHKQIAYSGYIQVDKGKLFYQKLGSGAPIIVLHGGPGLDTSYLLPQMLELVKHHEVIFYDQRGSGKSLETELSANTVNMDQFVKDLEDLRIHLGIKKFILMGHSWGGFLAMNYAVKHPEKISSLILLNTAPADYKGQQAVGDEFTKKTQHLDPRINTLFKKDDLEKMKAPEISKLYKTLFSVYFYNQNDVNKLTLNMSETSAQSGLKVIEYMSQTNSWMTPNINLFPKLKKLKTPTLIVHANQDIIPLWTAQAIKEAIPHSQIIYIDQCGHFPYIEKASPLFSAITTFITKQG